MSSLGSPNPFFIAGKKAYEVERSLRFNDGDSAYLNRTPSSAGNRKTFTLSVWVKRGSEFSDEEPILAADTTSAIRFSSEGGSDSKINVYYYSGGWVYRVHTNAELRDPSAWYHLVIAFDTTQATASNRIKIYQNGVQLTDMGNSDYPSQNYDTAFNNTVLHTIGRNGTSGDYFDGYMAEYNFIDGLQLTPASFGATDVITGQWNPKKYTGSYGTNGFYLNFSDNSGTTATTLGKDSSGNGHNFTPNNFSVSAGAGNDSLEDTPTNNFATINPLAAYLTNFEVPSNGNLDFSLAQHEFAMSSFEIPSSGKWYAEVLFTTAASGRIGISNPNRMNEGTGGTQKFNGIDNLGATIVVDGSTVQTGNLARGDGDITGISVDRDAGTVSFTVNGSASGTAVNISSMNDSSQLVFRVGRNSSSGSAPTGSINFGQRPFSYLPTGFKALNSANLPDPAILLPNKHFEARAYTGTGAGNTQTLTGFEFAPDLVWGKSRTSAYNHGIFDTVRGATNRLWPNLTNAEASNNAVTAFTSDGYSVSTDAFNQNSQVTWNWNAGGSTVTNDDGSVDSQVRANTTAGFSIVTYTGDNASATVGHGLGVAPKVVMVKRRNGTGDWIIGHDGLASNAFANNKFLKLASNSATFTNSLVWGSQPTSTVVQIVTGSGAGNLNGSSDTYVMYCFSEVAGYSKFGKYTGNGSADGTFVFTGFRPAFVLIKSSSNTENWYIIDNKRPEYNGALGSSGIMKWLKANSSDAENQNGLFNFLSNGFKLGYPGADTNGSGRTYIYLAFAESPFRNARAR